jgi:hypothetical protein
VVPTLVRALARNDTSTVPAMRTLGNIVTGNDVQTQMVLEAGFLPAIIALLPRAKRSLAKEICWSISNITAGTPQQIQAVIDSGALQALIK